MGVESQPNPAFEAAALFAREAESAARADVAQIPRAQFSRAQIGAVLIEIYRIVRKNLEAGKYDPDRPAPSMIGTVPIMPHKPGVKGGGCC